VSIEADVEAIDLVSLRQAVALFYDGKNAPTVSAKGEADIAEEIIAIAQASGVPLCDNAELTKLLMTLELGDSIPESLYLSIATIIAFAYELTGKTP
jgi:flagellar biosynthesis protein